MDFGVYSERRLFIGTVHSFCLNCVLRPYAGLVHPRFKEGVSVAGSKRAEFLLDTALALIGLNERASYYEPTITRLRRRKACGEDISGFEDSDLRVLEEYEGLLAADGLVDFEWMVTLTLDLIQENSWIRKLLGARFPWLIVDEYQDLGGPLHRIVTTLVDNAEIKVFAVGDPDQTIYDFTGADPRYLAELSGRPDFKPIRLKFNYRSGQRLIDASQAALSPEQAREYESDPQQTDQGEVFFSEAEDHLEDHAAKTIRAVEQALEQGIPAEEIAVFYQRKTILLDELRTEMDNSGIAYIAERDSLYPSSPTIRWLQDAASWAVSAPFARETLFEDLVRHYAGLLLSAGRIDGYSAPLDVRLQLYNALLESINEDVTLREWLLKVDHSLALREALTASVEHSNDLETFDELVSLTESGKTLEETRLLDFASDGRVRGKVVLTTFHSSKGRQFDIVIIPGLVEGVLPIWRWNRRKFKYDSPATHLLRQARRLFYVGFTRARKAVYLVYSSGYIYKGHHVSLGVSRFANEISEKLGARE
jgi:DNA helicase-2/ATP-dependent DNA helicase PcrA